jgi:hypothetical protein
MLSKKALELLSVLFAENSNLNLPVATAEQVLEVREFVQKELKSDQSNDQTS